MLIFPNPTDGKSTVLFHKSLDNATVKVINIKRVKVLEKIHYSGSRIQLDISDQASGLYEIEIVENGETYTAKLTKV